MENSSLINVIIYNTMDSALQIKSPDFKEINDLAVPPNHSIPVKFNFPNHLKVHQDGWIDKDGNAVMYITLVDKDF
jgi:hypothetical protein